MSETGYLIAFISVAAIATFATRIIPFLFFERHTEHPLIKHLGRYLPAAVMALLATVFLQRSGDWSATVPGLDAILAGALVVIGDIDPAYPLAKPAHVHGNYQLRDLPALVARYGVTAWFIPSIWPETFSFTTHEALATGMPVYSYDIGAQGEALSRAVKAGAEGAVLPLGSAQATGAAILADLKRLGYGG